MVAFFLLSTDCNNRFYNVILFTSSCNTSLLLLPAINVTSNKEWEQCETGNVKRFFLLLLGSFLSLSAWAQTGVICGTVSDAKFKDALIGASVVIEGTTVGAIADVEGNFRIENVKPGKYTIVASYVSYKSETLGCG